jgi:hypothetical protein
MPAPPAAALAKALDDVGIYARDINYQQYNNDFNPPQNPPFQQL